MTDGYLTFVKNTILGWPGVSVHPHRFGGTEFRVGAAEAGHVHEDGTLDIPFPRAVRDELIAQNRVRQHRWVPNSGWSTFQIRAASDADHALWLMRLSYLRYALKTAPCPHRMFEQESDRLELNSVLRRALEQFVPRGNGIAGTIATEEHTVKPAWHL